MTSKQIADSLLFEAWAATFSEEALHRNVREDLSCNPEHCAACAANEAMHECFEASDLGALDTNSLLVTLGL